MTTIFEIKCLRVTEKQVEGGGRKRGRGEYEVAEVREKRSVERGNRTEVECIV